MITCASSMRPKLTAAKRRSPRRMAGFKRAENVAGEKREVAAEKRQLFEQLDGQTGMSVSGREGTWMVTAVQSVRPGRRVLSCCC